MATKTQHVAVYLVGMVPQIEASIQHINAMIQLGWSVELMTSTHGGVLAVCFARTDGKIDIAAKVVNSDEKRLARYGGEGY
jgi:hypothetical protein